MSEYLTSRARVWEKLDRFRTQRVLLVTHARPDGDALGSLCGLLLFLRANGFHADAMLPADVPDYYCEFLPEEGLLPAEPPRAELPDYALTVTLDVSRRARAAADFITCGADAPMPVLNIDHHPDNPGFGAWNYVEKEASATSELLAGMAFDTDAEIPRAAATHWLLGILTDTGAFRFSNTTPASLRTAAQLADRSGEYQKAVSACFFAKPEKLARFEADLLCHHLKKTSDGKFFYVYFDPALLAKYDIELRNTEQVIEILRAISGPLIVATVRRESGSFKCSLRSRAGYSAGRIARAAGGGGHDMAAGCTINAASFKEAEQILLSYVKKELNQ